MIIEWDPRRPKKRSTDILTETLTSGGIVAYPTDTYYGMGCDLFNIKAIRSLYSIKRLDSKRALSVICRDIKEASAYAVISDHTFSILKRCLPGPYTFVLRAKKIMPKLLMTEKKEVGIRVPNHPVPAALSALIDRPIINTTARMAGEEPIMDPRAIEKQFKGRVDVVIDGEIFVSDPSTVIRIVDDDIEILRFGKGPVTDLLQG